jgi:hypothetical protein
VSGKDHLLILAHGRDFQIVLDCTEPIVRIKRGGALGENRWISILEVPKLGSWAVFTITSIVVVSRGKLRNILQGRDVGLALSASGLTVFHKEAKDLSHIGFRWRWRVVLVRAAASVNHLMR